MLEDLIFSHGNEGRAGQTQSTNGKNPTVHGGGRVSQETSTSGSAAGRYLVNEATSPNEMAREPGKKHSFGWMVYELLRDMI
jgi:hypothetical protein